MQILIQKVGVGLGYCLGYSSIQDTAALLVFGFPLSAEG